MEPMSDETVGQSKAFQCRSLCKASESISASRKGQRRPCLLWKGAWQTKFQAQLLLLLSLVTAVKSS